MKKMFTLLLIINALNATSQNCITNTNSLIFNSSYIYLDSNAALNITDSITIEAWIKSNSWAFTSAQNTIVCKHGWSTGESGYVFRAGGSGQLSFNIGGTDSAAVTAWHEVVSSTSALQLNTWYHVAATYNGHYMRLYINGVLAGSNAFNGTIKSSTYKVKIGKLSDTVQTETRYWDGKLDEIRIWHRVLDATELTAHMNHHLDTSTAVDLVGYWRFNEGSGSIATDLSHSMLNGSIINGSSSSWSTDVPFGNGPSVPYIIQAGIYLYSSSLVNNQWYLNGNPIPGATTDTYIPTLNGSYTVEVSDTSGCTSASQPFVITSLAIDESLEAKLLINQKFSSGILRFYSTPGTLQNAEFNLFDINGRTVLSIGKGNLKDELNLNYLSQGVYISRINIDNLSYQDRLVVQ